MDLTTATILIKALFQEYYNDRTMMVTVKDEYRDAEAKREYLEDKLMSGIKNLKNQAIK